MMVIIINTRVRHIVMSVLINKTLVYVEETVTIQYIPFIKNSSKCGTVLRLLACHCRLQYPYQTIVTTVCVYVRGGGHLMYEARGKSKMK
jgi:hypothetical protein